MLKLITLFFLVTILTACVTETSDKTFAGMGDFDTVEAAKTRVSLGLTYLKNGNFSQAKFNLDKALEFDPRSGQGNFAMAFYYQQVGEFARADEYYKTALSYSSNDPDVLNSYGAFLCQQGKYVEAKSYFLKAVDDKSYISTASTYENLAICSKSNGLNDEAIAYLKSALNHQPTRASSLLYLAELQAELGKWEEAKKTLWKYERNNVVSAESLWVSYQIANGQNNLNSAIEYADILKRMFPNHENTKKAIAQLGKFQPNSVVTSKNPSVVKLNEDASLPINSQIVSNESLNEIELSVQNGISQAEKTEQNITTAQETLTNAETEAFLADAIVAQEIADTKQQTEELSQKTINKVEDAVATVDNNIARKVESAEELSKQIDKQAFHVVQPKENLYRISLKYNVTVQKLLEWNNLNNASSILIGTKLRVRDPNTNE